MRRPPKTALSLILAFGLLVTACGDGTTTDTTEAPEVTTTEAPEVTSSEAGNPGTTAPPTTECEDVTELEVSVPTQPPKFAQLVPPMADALGYYDEYCLDVTIIGFRTGANALRAMQSGETPIGVPSSNVAVVAIGQGSPIVIFGSPAAFLPQIILATEGIESCEDLEGVTIGTEGPGGLGHYLFTLYLETCGLDINSDVDVFAGAPGDFAALLDQGVIQSAALHVDDKALIEEQFGITLNVLELSSQLVPNFHYQSFAARSDWVAGDVNRDALVRFMAAILATEQYMADPANREEVVELGAELSGRPLGVIDFAYDLYSYPTSCAEGLSEDSFVDTAQLQVDVGEMPEAPAFETMVDVSICQDAEALVEQ